MGKCYESKADVMLSVIGVLEHETDETHPLSMEEIAIRASSDSLHRHDCPPIHRNTISRYINYVLPDYGYEIVKAPGRKGYYLNHGVTLEELEGIFEAIYGDPSLTNEEAEKTFDFFMSHQSKYAKSYFSPLAYRLKKIRSVKTDYHLHIIRNMRLVSTAIQKKEKIRCDLFVESYLTRENVLKEETRIVSPYGLLSKQGGFYLLCHFEGGRVIEEVDMRNILMVYPLDDSHQDNPSLIENRFDPSRGLKNDKAILFRPDEVSATLLVKSSIQFRLMKGYLELPESDITKFDQEGGATIEVTCPRRKLVELAIAHPNTFIVRGPEIVLKQIGFNVDCLKRNYEVKPK